VVTAQVIHGAQMGETRSADMTTIGFVGAIRHQINAEFALWRFDGCIDLTGGNFEPFGVELEVVDERFHGLLHLTALWRNDLPVSGGYRPLPVGSVQLFNALRHNPSGLAHFFHADKVTIVAVAV